MKYINDYQQVASNLIALICASVAFLTFWSGLLFERPNYAFFI